VRGKLVEQDSNDELASELLKKIQAEKRHLVKNGIIGKQALLPSIDELNLPFAVPSGWCWTRLGALSQLVTSGSRDWAKYYSSEGAIFLRMGNLSRDSYCLRLTNIQHVNPPADGEGSRTKLREGDILISITGDVGLLGLIPADFGEAYINQHTCLVRPVESMVGRFLPQVFSSPFGQGQFDEPQRGLKNSFRLTDVMHFLVPLPPLSEQGRIATKVDELMALCDRLEATQREQETRREQLTASAHYHLNSGEYADELRIHAQFFIGHLPRLTKRPDQIRQLRQTILNLAVKGKLVDQSPNDKPASELLKCNDVARTKLVKAGVIKAQKGTEASQTRFLAFDLPDNWKAASLGEIAFSFKYGTSVKCSYEAGGEPVLRIPNIDNGKINIDDLKFGPLSKREADDLRLRLGDILMVRSNGSLELVGRPAIIESASVGYCYAGYLVRVRTSVDHIDTRYLLLALNSPHTRTQIEVPIRSAVGLKNVNTTELSSLLIPLPPLAEQHRIVAKVDKLMAFCDKLEANLSTAQTETSRLLESVLHAALNGDHRRIDQG
jgi:type I restriction enzyme S subunit